MSKITRKYTLVRHSAWVAAKDPRFKRAVEKKALTTQGDLDKVQSVGGLVLDDYQAADIACEASNYPPGATGVIPCVPGKFARARLGWAEIYLPPVTESR